MVKVRGASGQSIVASALSLCVALGLCSVHDVFASVSDCRYSAAGSPSVVDNDTKLVWQAGTDGQGGDTLQEAEQYCAMLTSDGAAWRLPTVQELHSLVDESQAGSKIDKTRFMIPPAATMYAPIDFWSSTPVAGEANQMWGVDFSTGFTVKLTASPGDASASTPAYVRCVR